MDNIVKFDKPYKFEGKEYDSLDLSGMEKMTVLICWKRSRR